MAAIVCSLRPIICAYRACQMCSPRPVRCDRGTPDSRTSWVALLWLADRASGLQTSQGSLLHSAPQGHGPVPAESVDTWSHVPSVIWPSCTCGQSPGLRPAPASGRTVAVVPLVAATAGATEVAASSQNCVPHPGTGHCGGGVTGCALPDGWGQPLPGLLVRWHQVSWHVEGHLLCPHMLAPLCVRTLVVRFRAHHHNLV